MQIHTIAKSIGKFAAFTAVAVFLSACAAADWGCWYPPGCAPRSGPPKPQLTPREAAQFQAQELYQQAKVHISKARYRQAERVLKGSIRIFENALGREAPEPLGPLTTLTNLYIHTDRSAEAVKLLLKRPRIRETVLGRLNSRYPEGDHEEWNEATATFKAEFYVEAEAQYERALQVREKAHGAEHSNLVPVLIDLAELYREQQRYADAEAAYLRVLTIRERALGPEHPDVVESLNDLVNLYLIQSRYDEVESIYKRLITIKEASLGAEQPDVSEAFKTLARFYQAQGRYADAESIYKRLITIKEASLGVEHPDVAEARKTLARFYQGQGRYAEAEPIYKRQLAMYEKASARQGIAESLQDLAHLYDDQGRHALAEVFRHRSWELSSSYCYRSEDNRMIRITPKWAECITGVYVTRSELEEWVGSRDTFGEKFRRREAAE